MRRPSSALSVGLFGGDLVLEAKIFLQPVNQIQNKEKCKLTITTCTRLINSGRAGVAWGQLFVKT